MEPETNYLIVVSEGGIYMWEVLQSGRQVTKTRSIAVDHTIVHVLLTHIEFSAMWVFQENYDSIFRKIGLVVEKLNQIIRMKRAAFSVSKNYFTRGAA